MPMIKGKLTDRQRLFVDNLFLNNFNQTQAALAAGLTSGNAYISRLMRNPAVAKEIEIRRARLRDKQEIDEAWIQQRLARIADSGAILSRYRVVQPDGSISYDFTNAPIEDLAVITDMTTKVYMEGKGDDAVAVKEFKVGVDSPKAALDSLMKLKGLGRENVNNTGEGSVVDRLSKGRERMKKTPT